MRRLFDENGGVAFLFDSPGQVWTLLLVDVKDARNGLLSFATNRQGVMDKQLVELSGPLVVIDVLMSMVGDLTDPLERSGMLIQIRLLIERKGVTRLWLCEEPSASATAS